MQRIGAVAEQIDKHALEDSSHEPREARRLVLCVRLAFGCFDDELQLGYDWARVRIGCFLKEGEEPWYPGVRHVETFEQLLLLCFEDQFHVMVGVIEQDGALDENVESGDVCALGVGRERSSKAWIIHLSYLPCRKKSARVPPRKE